MTQIATAEIIPFPARSPAPMPAAYPAVPAVDAVPLSPDQVRLARALSNLNDAVTAQRVAMAAWKSSLGDLRTATRRLGGSLRSYNDSLGRLDGRVSALRAEAVKLEAWADNALNRKG